MCGNHIPIHVGIEPFAIDVLINILEHRYTVNIITEGKSLAYLLCLGASLHKANAKRLDTIIDIQVLSREKSSAVKRLFPCHDSFNNVPK